MTTTETLWGDFSGCYLKAFFSSEMTTHVDYFYNIKCSLVCRQKKKIFFGI